MSYDTGSTCFQMIGVSLLFGDRKRRDSRYHSAIGTKMIRNGLSPAVREEYPLSAAGDRPLLSLRIF